MDDSGRLSAAFLLCACQGGAEAALRQRVLEVAPGLRAAAWRRGVVTFRRPPADPVDPGRLAEQLVFARTVIHSLGQVTAAEPAGLAAAAIALTAGMRPANVHAWCRDPRTGIDVQAARAAVLAACGLEPGLAPVAAPGSLVLDCVIDSVDRWWVGWHRADWPAGRWPGGVYPGGADPEAVSRAWLKLDEAIACLEIPFAPGQRAVELGAAPGGACQRLLAAGLEVVGVDPAPLADRLVPGPGFSHWRMRARDVPVRRFRGIDWLLADMNIDPRSTVAALGRVATAAGVRLRGIVATLKLPDWSRAAELDGWLAAVRDWGFAPRARQLSTGGREICLVAERAAGPPRNLPRSRSAAGGRVTRPARRPRAG